MSKSNALENALLLLLFNNDDFANVGDASGIQGSASDGNLYVSLHTGDPGEAGNQTTSEATYTDYARVAVARTTGGWTISTNSVVNAADIDFPQASGGSNTITHFGVGTASSGAGILLYKGALTASLAVSAGITPSFTAGNLTITED